MMRKRTVTRPSNQGFALLLSLFLMSFVLVILLTIVTLVQVETTTSAHSLSQLRAREAARLALMQAIGQLQKHAGPDQRVTARADILGDGNYAPEAKYWTGVWDTTNPSADPVWLVSGAMPDPNNVNPSNISITSGYDANGNNDFNDDGDYPASKAPLQEIPGSDLRFAWKIEDEGIKAPLSVVETLATEIDNLPINTAYLDYNSVSEKILPAITDRVFEYPDLVDIYDEDQAGKVDSLSKVITTSGIEILTTDLSAITTSEIQARLVHDYSISNDFVLANTADGGLKKDLSYLKTVDPATLGQTQIDALYGDNQNLITSETIKLLQFKGNPIAFPTDEIIGMQLNEDTVSAIEAKAVDFTIAPTITEFQLSAGIASTDGNQTNATVTNSQVYFIYKVYLELWNPYTIPLRIGDLTLPEELGYSDIEIEIQNLPSYSIENLNNPAGLVTGTLPNIQIKWSDHDGPQTLRPGMVYKTTLPLDSNGDNNSGTVQLPLTGIMMTGSRSDNYVGQFNFGSNPLTIILYGINATGLRKQIHIAEIENYPNFIIDYDYNNYNNRVSWFKRMPSAEYDSEYGMHTPSLEVPGYAFGFHYKMLDEQEYSGTFADISKWLSLTDPRYRRIKVDLSSWDINEAWELDTPLPFNFNSSPTSYDPGMFQPGESFKDLDFFHYKPTTAGGRRDRIARFIDLPTSEITELGVLRSLKYKDIPANGIGNSWGADLNAYYDRYFFSTLPDPSMATWDGISPLANPRIKAIDNIPALVNVNSAELLMIKNGFNINSTSTISWQSVLKGKSFQANEFELKFEKNEAAYYNSPEWFTLSENLNNVFFNLPQTAIYNLAESESTTAAYEFITKENTADYGAAFRIDNPTWNTNLQFPAFWQSSRELDDTSIEALSQEVVSRIQGYMSVEGHPFFSIRDFLDSNILQESINATPTINYRTGNTDLIPPHAPAYFSQATILNALGSFIFAKSDSFTVTAYGASLHPITGEPTSEAYYKARLQRTPSEHAVTEFGRQYQIIDVQWIEAP